MLLARDEMARAQHALTAPGSVAFAPALAMVATVVLVLSVTWLWCVMSAAALEALHGVHAVELPGLRGAVRRMVLAGCGVALAAGVAPAHADDVRGVAGQPPQPLTSVAQAPAPRTHVVEKGDSLWSISASRLGPDATDAEIDHAWRALWQANRGVVGPDPDVLEPGQRLDVPGALR